MEQKQTESAISVRKTDGAARYLPCVDRLETNAEFYEAVSENDEEVRVICCGERTVGLAIVSGGGEEGYLYVYVFPEYRNNGFGCAAVKCAEQEIFSPELKKIYASYRADNEAARRFAEKCGYPKKYSSSHMAYHGERFALAELPIRQYQDGDYAQAFALSAEAFHKMRLETGCFPDSVPGEPSDEGRRSWAETAEERYVYEAGGELVGYAHLDGSELDSVSIKISRQGEGFGKNFVRFLVNRIMEKEQDDPTLWCVNGNDKARRLYDSLGFQEDGCEAFAIKSDFADGCPTASGPDPEGR